MADGLFVVNASPLILLAAIDGLSLLPKLASEILVVREVRAGRDPHPALLRLESTAWLNIAPSLSIPEDIGGWDLGDGESQVLAHALSRRAAGAVLDDRQARRCAESLGIQTTGTLGLVLRAKRRGLIPAARPLIEGLLQHRLYLSDDLVEAALAEVGE